MWYIMNFSWFDLSSSDSLADRIPFNLERKLVPRRNCAGLRANGFSATTILAIFPISVFYSNGSSP